MAGQPPTPPPASYQRLSRKRSNLLSDEPLFNKRCAFCMHWSVACFCWQAGVPPRTVLGLNSAPTLLGCSPKTDLLRSGSSDSNETSLRAAQNLPAQPAEPSKGDATGGAPANASAEPERAVLGALLVLQNGSTDSGSPVKSLAAAPTGSTNENADPAAAAAAAAPAALKRGKLVAVPPRYLKELDEANACLDQLLRPGDGRKQEQQDALQDCVCLSGGTFLSSS
jgi:hypothetical protein